MYDHRTPKCDSYKIQACDNCTIKQNMACVRVCACDRTPFTARPGMSRCFFFRLYQIVILGYLADLIISHSLKTEWKILENTKGRLKEEIFLFFLIPFQEDYSIAFKLILKLGVLQD